MALIMYLTKAPRYENVTVKEIQLIESYLSWQREKEIGSRYASDTFEQWCGHSESELPGKNIIEHYKKFYTKKLGYIEGIGKSEIYGLFEHSARIVKANQLFNWFINHVANGSMDKEYHEVTKEQLLLLSDTCRKVKDNFKLIGKNKYSNEDEYEVNEKNAKELLPLMDKVGYFFGPRVYGELYAEQVIKMISIIDEILATTNFEEQVVYFNAIW